MDSDFDHASPFNSIKNEKNEIDIEIFSHDEDKSRDSFINETISTKTLENKAPPKPNEPKKQVNQAETSLNPDFNLENNDNIFYYLYNYVREERKSILEKKDKEFNGEPISSFKPLNNKLKNDGSSNGNIQIKKLIKVDTETYQKTKFIQDSLKRKFRENQDTINLTNEKDTLVRDFAKKHINPESVRDLLEKEFSYY